MVCSFSPPPPLFLFPHYFGLNLGMSLQLCSTGEPVLASFSFSFSPLFFPLGFYIQFGKRTGGISPLFPFFFPPLSPFPQTDPKPSWNLFGPQVGFFFFLSLSRESRSETSPLSLFSSPPPPLLPPGESPSGKRELFDELAVFRD